ncbi:MAG TPA: flagellin [Bryobacteraceae bacterium]|nr:flagellin [Bryobacteraceae bacterium]
MSLTVQTNIASLIAQSNLNLNNTFMTQTIQRLTSGYRINSSADDAAGLVIANQYRSSITELTQGVRNANDGISTLQIIDGGLNNISSMLDRMKTLATQSASGTFNGNRATLDQEYQQLIGEITRQATDIGLVTGGANAQNMSVYIGGGPAGGALSNSTISVNLATSIVDATGLGLTGTAVSGANVGAQFGSPVDLRTGTFLGTTQVTLTVNTANGQHIATVGGTGTAQTGAALVQQINQQIAGSGVSARINSTTGFLEFVGGPFVIDNAGTGAASFSGATATGLTNGALYNENLAFTSPVATASQTVTFNVGGVNTNVVLASGTTIAGAVNLINQTMNSQGVYAVANTAGDHILLSGNVAFTPSFTPGTSTAGFVGDTFAAATAPTITGSGTQAATSAITAINNAIATLGTVQGVVGAGQNKLNYAIGLANSQVTSFSAAQSRIRDADMAAEAANLTKAQILEQSSVAALAQANAAPQAVLALLK